MTQRQVANVLAERSAQRFDKLAAEARRVAHRPDEAAALAKALKDVAGRRSAKSQKALKELRSSAVLTPPLKARGLPPSLAPSGRPVTRVLAPQIRAKIEEVAERIVQRDPVRFERLLAALGKPRGGQWAALLERAIAFKVEGRAETAGQVATVSGWLLESLRKSTAMHLDGHRRTHAAVEAYNAYRLRQHLAAVAPAGREAGRRAFAERLEFGEPQFIENIVDANGKALSDGMWIARNRAGELLILQIDEVKLETVSREVLTQVDDVLARIRGGIRIGTERFPGNKIILPQLTHSGPLPTELVAFLENAAKRELTTPHGHKLTVVAVDAMGVRTFVEEFLLEWQRALAAGLR